MKRLPFLLPLALAACVEEPDLIPLHFAGPVAAAVLPAGEAVWDNPAGFVANSRDGTITPLDLKLGRLLNDDPTGTFLRAALLPTGHARILSDVAVVTSEAGEVVTLWAVDQAFEQLLQIPYVTGVDANGWPVEVEPTATDPVLIDVDGSGDDATLTDVTVRAGYTTTEDWSVEHDGERWWVKGSRSGTQEMAPVAGEAWHSDDGELAFTLTGTATAGDRIELRTETSLLEYTFDARLLGLHAMGGRVYASLATQPGRIVVLDGLTGEYLGGVELPAGSQPTRMTSDPYGRLYVGDGALPVVWLLRFDEATDPAAVAVESIPVAAPAVDVAWQGGFDRDGEPFDVLHVAPAGLLRVDVYDTAAQAWIDPNPYTPEVEGIFLGTPVVGLAASAGDTFLPHETAWGGNARVPTVAAATADGFTYLLEASTGCGVLDALGPYAEPLDDSSYIYLDDQGEPSDASLDIDLDAGWQVVGSTCGGVTRAETWTVTFDAATLSWEVEGSLSGVQAARAYESERYLSDTGALSFLIRAGTLPATQGDRFGFVTDDGLRVFRGSDEDEDGTVNPAWESPGRPVGFEVASGPSGGGWDPVGVTQYVLLPVTNSDLAARLDLDTAKTEVLWR